MFICGLIYSRFLAREAGNRAGETTCNVHSKEVLIHESKNFFMLGWAGLKGCGSTRNDNVWPFPRTGTGPKTATKVKIVRTCSSPGCGFRNSGWRSINLRLEKVRPRVSV